MFHIHCFQQLSIILTLRVLHDILPSLTYDLDEDTYGSGNYRSCDQFLIRLARLYLFVNTKRKDKLKTFPQIPQRDPYSTILIIAFVDDGAPISGMSSLVSFINVGKRISKRISNSAENFKFFDER